MEKLYQIIAKLMEPLFWQSLLSHFHLADWVTAGFLIIGLVYGMRKGLMREIVEFFEMVIILTVTFAFQPMVNSFLGTYLPKVSQGYLAPAGFILTAFCAWFVVSVIDQYMQKWIHAKLGGFFKVVGGAAVGVCHFFLIWSFLSQAVLLLPLRQAQKIYETGGSITGERVKNFAPAVYAMIAGRGPLSKAKA